MATRFYAYLGGSTGPLTKIDCPALADINDFHRPDLRVPMSQEGVPFPTLLGYVYDIQIRAVFAGPAPQGTERNLQAVCNHLNRGGLVGFTLAHGRCFATQGRLPVLGATTLTHASNGLGSWEPAAVLADGDEVVIEDPFPSCRRDIYTVASRTATTTTIDDGTRIDFRYHPLIRERYTFPVLYREQGSAPVQANIVKGVNSHIYFSFEADLVYAPALAFSLLNGGSAGKWAIDGAIPGLGAGAGLLRADTSTGYQMTGQTIEDLVAPLKGGPTIVRPYGSRS